MSEFIAKISVTCFAASYLVGWLLEVCRLFFRSGIRKAVMIGFVVAGMIAHTLYLMHRATSANVSPLSSTFDWYLMAAWLLVGVYLYVNYYYPQAAIGLFVLPLSLGLIVAAAMFADRQPIAPEPASQVWGMIHGVFLLLGTVAVIVGFVAGLMYLFQSYRLKHKLPPLAGFRFPSLELLEHVNSSMIVTSALLIAIGFVAGIILKFVGGGRVEDLPWTDPVVWTTGIMLAWLVAAALFNLLYQPARQGRKVAYLTVANFVFLAVALGVFMLGDSHQSGKKVGGDKPPVAAVSFFREDIA